MEDRCFIILRVGSLHRGHFLFEGLAVRVCVLAIFAVDFRQGVDVGSLSCRGLWVAGGDLLRLIERHAAGGGVSVVPHSAMAHCGSCLEISVKVCRACSYSNECSNATARLKFSARSVRHDVEK